MLTGAGEPTGYVGTVEDITQGKLSEEELRASREQLRAFAAHLQSIREEERKLIAREIHDELGQSLTGFKMDLAWMRNRMQAEDAALIREPILDKIKTVGGLIDGTANLVRKLCTELRPGVLDDLGLTAAIEWQAREYQSRTGIVCDVKLGMGDLAGGPRSLDRIVQDFSGDLDERGAACARHSGAGGLESDRGRSLAGSEGQRSRHQAGRDRRLEIPRPARHARAGVHPRRGSGDLRRSGEGNHGAGAGAVAGIQVDAGDRRKEKTAIRASERLQASQ